MDGEKDIIDQKFWTAPDKTGNTSEVGPVQIDHDLERKLVRKLDLHIVPIVMLLYLFSFLDRYVRSMRMFLDQYV